MRRVMSIRWLRPLWGLAVTGAIVTTPTVAQEDAARTGLTVEAQFERAYAQWRELTSGPSLRSDSNWMWALPEYRAIVALGPPVLPYLVERVCNGPADRTGPRALDLLPAFTEITKWDPTVWAQPTADAGLASQRDAVAAWWTGGAPGIDGTFSDLHAAWHEAVGQGTDEVVLYTLEMRLRPGYGSMSQSRPIPTAPGRIYLRVEALGIAVLPMLLEEVEAGHVEWLPLIIRLTDGAPPVNPMLTVEMRVAQVREWWEANKQDWLIPWPEEDKDE